MSLKNVLTKHRISANTLRQHILQSGRQAGKPLSAAAMSRLLNAGEFPAETPQEAIAKQIGEFFDARQIAVDIKALWPTAPTANQSLDVNPAPDAGSTTEVKTMLPTAHIVTQPARKKFGIQFNPFEGFPQIEADYYLTDSMYVALEAFQEAAHLGVVRAIVGESGSGKTTLKKLFKLRSADSLNIVDVLVTTMSDNDKRGGRVMPSNQIHMALIRQLAGDDAKIPADADARQKKSRRLLQASAEAGRRTLLIIDEGHDLPSATLAHLKRFSEFAEGALGIVVIGQYGLQRKLTPRLNPDIKEVGQRFPVELLPPLEPDEIKDYLDKRLHRAGASFAKVFEADAPAALHHNLRRAVQDKRATVWISEAYPLAIGNLAAAAINRCAQLGFERVSADLINATAREISE